MPCISVLCSLLHAYVLSISVLVFANDFVLYVGIKANYDLYALVNEQKNLVEI